MFTAWGNGDSISDEETIVLKENQTSQTGRMANRI